MSRPASQKEKNAPQQPTRRAPQVVLEVACIAAIVIVTILAYRPALRGGFIWDDYTYIINGELNQNPNGLPRIWFSTDPVDYFPVAYSLQWMEYRVWKLDPEPYHVVNLALHCAAVILLGLVLRRIAAPGAWIAAGLFAVHPVNVESVAWIYQQRTTLPLVFALLSTLAFLRFERTGRMIWQVASVAAFVFALLSKTSVVMFPFVLLGLCWWQRNAIRRADLLRVAPHFAAAVGLGLVTLWFQYHRAIGTAVIREDNMIARLVTAAWAVWFYAYKAFVPLNLSFVYPRWVVHAASPLAWLPLVGLIAVFAVLWRFRQTWGRGALAAFGYFVITLLPMLGFLNIFFMKYSLVADHWQYVGLAGLLALPAAGLAILIARQRAVGTVCVIGIIAGLAYLTSQQSKVYADETTVWKDTVQKNPGAWIAWNNMGADLIRDGAYEQARPLFEKTLELNPRFSKAINNLAVIEAQRGNLARAMELCQQAIALHDEGEADARLNVGRILFLQGRPQEAIASYHAALKIDNKFSLAYLNLAEALIQIGNKAEAAEALRTLLQFDRNNAEAAELLRTLGGP